MKFVDPSTKFYDPYGTNEYSKRHGNWLLKNHSIEATQRLIIFDKGEELHSEVIISLKIQRRAEGFKYQVIVPALIISMSNILFLSIDPASYERIVLFILNILSNFTYVEQLRWMLPFDGDEQPNILMFFLESQCITVCLIFYSIFMATDRDGQKLSLWKLKMINIAESFKIGKFLFTSTGSENDGKKWTFLMDRLTAVIIAIIYGGMFVDALIGTEN